MSYAAIEPPEPIPHVDDRSTWRRCLTPGCPNRVNPLEHNHRCAEHRAAHAEHARRVLEYAGRRAADVVSP